MTASLRNSDNSNQMFSVFKILTQILILKTWAIHLSFNKCLPFLEKNSTTKQNKIINFLLSGFKMRKRNIQPQFIKNSQAKKYLGSPSLTQSTSSLCRGCYKRETVSCLKELTIEKECTPWAPHMKN